MNGIVDKGTGVPIVLIPGLQGRWEWMRPAVDALAKHYRVITFSLCDERTSPFPCRPEKAFENYIEQVDLALDRAHVEQAVIAGVSYGGLIATEFAARFPRRVAGLVLPGTTKYLLDEVIEEPTKNEPAYLLECAKEIAAKRGDLPGASGMRNS